ncbi:MAG: hypothetical protein ACTHU0_03570 [Kofleriaceae bacterium]
MRPDPAWKRVVGGLCGLGLLVGVVVVLRQSGASGAEIQQWQQAIVFGAAIAFGIGYLVRKRKRDRG